MEQTHQYKNIKTKLYKNNAAIWYNKTCRMKQLTPSCISIKVNGSSIQTFTYIQWHIPDIVLMQLILLMMSTGVL